ELPLSRFRHPDNSEHGPSPCSNRFPSPSPPRRILPPKLGDWLAGQCSPPTRRLSPLLGRRRFWLGLVHRLSARRRRLRFDYDWQQRPAPTTKVMLLRENVSFQDLHFRIIGRQPEAEVQFAGR